MASRSRWLVGSSSTRTFTPRAWSRARDARVRSPGESSSTGRFTWSALRPNLASRVRTSPEAISGTSASTAAASGTVPASSERAWSISPICTLDPRAAVPSSGAWRPSSARSRVDLPAPLGPVMPIRSPAFTWRDTGPSVKPPCRKTASLRVATTELERGAAPMVNSSLHSLRGSSTSSRRAMRLSICRTFWACFSLDSLLALRRSLSLSGDFFIALRTPWLDHSRWVRARETRSCFCSANSSYFSRAWRRRVARSSR